MSLLWLVCIITPCNNKRERQSLFSLKWSFSENSKYAESMFFEPKKIWSCYYREALFLFCWSKVFFAPNSQKLLVLVRLFLICRLKLLGPTIFTHKSPKEFVAVSINICPWSNPVQVDILTVCHGVYRQLILYSSGEKLYKRLTAIYYRNVQKSAHLKLLLKSLIGHHAWGQKLFSG